MRSSVPRAKVARGVTSISNLDVDGKKHDLFISSFIYKKHALKALGCQEEHTKSSIYSL